MSGADFQRPHSRRSLTAKDSTTLAAPSGLMCLEVGSTINTQMRNTVRQQCTTNTLPERLILGTHSRTKAGMRESSFPLGGHSWESRFRINERVMTKENVALHMDTQARGYMG